MTTPLRKNDPAKRDAEVQRFFDELEDAPVGKEISYTAAANARADEVVATGKVTMRELLFSGVVARKTVLKHIARGLLKGEKVLVRGVETWLFEPLHAKAYLESVMTVTTKARREAGNRAVQVEAPDGYLTVKDLVAVTGLSRFTISDCLNDGRLASEAHGAHGAKFIARAEAKRFVAAMAGKARPRSTKPDIARPAARERRRVVVTNRMVLIWLILDQPGETITGLSRDLRLAPQTVRRWANGEREPDDKNTGRIVAYARGRYAIAVGAELDALGKAYRADYMTSYMRARRA